MPVQTGLCYPHSSPERQETDDEHLFPVEKGPSRISQTVGKLRKAAFKNGELNLVRTIWGLRSGANQTEKTALDAGLAPPREWTA